MKDLSSLTKQAKELQNQQQQQAGYKKGMAGQFAADGRHDRSGATEQLAELTGDQSASGGGSSPRASPAQGVIMGMGTPERGAAVVQPQHRPRGPRSRPRGVPGRTTCTWSRRPRSLGQGVSLPIKVDPNDPAKIAIDWDAAPKGPPSGEVRPVAERAGDSRAAPTPSPSASGGVDTVAELERLAKLRDSGALTDAEFEQQKAKILGELAWMRGAAAAHRVPLVARVPLVGAGARDAARGDGRGGARPRGDRRPRDRHRGGRAGARSSSARRRSGSTERTFSRPARGAHRAGLPRLPPPRRPGLAAAGPEDLADALQAAVAG